LVYEEIRYAAGGYNLLLTSLYEKTAREVRKRRSKIKSEVQKNGTGPDFSPYIREIS